MPSLQPTPGHRARGLAALLLAAGATGCVSAPAPDPMPMLDAAEFVIMVGDSVVGTERTSRTLDRLHGEISLTGQARSSYVAELSGPGTVTTLEATIRSWQGPGGETLRVDLGPDSLVIRSSRWNNLPQTFRPGAAAVYLHPSPALLEILLRRALITGDSMPELPVWLAGQNVRAVARFTPEAGRVRVDVANTRVYLTHDNGTLLMGEVPALRWVFHRR
jgi:hypothetical protein